MQVPTAQYRFLSRTEQGIIASVSGNCNSLIRRKRIAISEHLNLCDSGSCAALRIRSWLAGRWEYRHVGVMSLMFWGLVRGYVSGFCSIPMPFDLSKTMPFAICPFFGMIRESYVERETGATLQTLHLPQALWQLR